MEIEQPEVDEPPPVEETAKSPEQAEEVKPPSEKEATVDLGAGEPEEEEEPEEPEEPAPEPQPTVETISTTAKPESLSPESDGDSPYNDIDVVAETTPTRPPKQKPFSTLIHPLHASLSSLRSATLFSQPIREQDAPGYSALVLKPTDLKTLWKQVKEGIVTESIVFHREVARMFANAIIYNAETCTPLFDLG
jgi:bromodomain-containing protein 8